MIRFFDPASGNLRNNLYSSKVRRPLWIWKRSTTGMWVESSEGLGRVLAVDKRDKMVLVEGLHDEQWAVPASLVNQDDQLHPGCDKYY